ncbi:DUF5994 family protein [Actinomycetospora termitidis]|uniref:DUF5994 family protein n=1 Tax=Actinomycetospora termitidis TaxID=3053470 RepID=A0ABT7MIB5_9PSEU|nr:DUF5994 family protein [Actinomycetospora sp. Odt1-22]MDL5159687.1 DUF5994 family protein [Actinomycetospora sp. Odt1-22]
MSGPDDVQDQSVSSDEVRVRLGHRGAGEHGAVDGAWWPRSRDLAAELPSLLDRIEDLVGPVERVAFGLSEWDDVGRRLITTRAGRIPVEGFRSIEASTVWLVVRGRGRSRIGLMVIPADTTQERAIRLLEAAALGGERRSPVEVLAVAMA